ncbi:MAG: hypothetical protein CSA23_03460 [Deltaproteobacteria bacterium]|nr:MAG: hypothetical protein CSA23_03460 [Deltaproteobacteria bacterium]
MNQIESCYIVLIALTAASTVAHYLGLDSEYWCPFILGNRRSLWWIHNDEKLIVPDSRYYYLRRSHTINANDFEPPNSSVFGPGSHLLIALGFRLFGMNNRGLRIFFMLAANLGDLFIALTIITMAPSALGLFFALVYLLTLSRFLLARHAIVEHFLHLSVALFIYTYVVDPDMVTSNLNALGVLAASTLVLKPNFPAYLLILLGIIGIVEKVGLGTLLGFAFTGVVALLIFEAGIYQFLKKHGIAHWRYKTVKDFLKEFSGRAKTPIETEFKPPGWKVFPDTLWMMVEWYLLPDGTKRLPRIKEIALEALGIALGGAVLLTIFSGRMPSVGWVILLFTVAYLVASVPMLFYPKRALILFQLLMVLAAMSMDQTLGMLVNDYGFPAGISQAIAAVVGFFIFMLQIRAMTYGSGFRTHAVAYNSKLLDAEVAEGEHIYAQVQSTRFFWMSKKPRFFSSDDNLRNNQRIFEWACQRHAYSLMISQRGGPGKKNGGNMNDVSKKPEGQYPVLRYINSYKTAPADSDDRDVYALFRISWPDEWPEWASKAEMPEKTGYLLQQIEAFSKSWDVCRMVGIKAELLDVCPEDYLKLLEYKVHLNQDARKELENLCAVLCENDAQKPVLTEFSEDLLIAALAKTGSLELAYRLVFEQGYNFHNPRNFVVIGDYFLEDNPQEAVRWYAEMPKKMLKRLKSMGVSSKDNSVIRKFGFTLSTIYNRASSFKSNGYYDCSEAIFLVLAKTAHNPGGIHFHLGELFLMRGEQKNALICFKKCIALVPNHAMARRRLNSIRNKTGNKSGLYQTIS